MLLGMLCRAQDGNNYMDVSSSIKNFSLNTVASLENEQVQTNAFTITVKSKNNNLSVYANISFYNSSNGYTLPAGAMSIKLNTVTPSRTANFNKIPISGGNQLILSTTKTSNSTVAYSYNLNVGPIGYDAPPGTYNATILFTMTQP